ncbi:MAG: M56 family metallopeptidase [Oscillospiraceae bacterium]
MWYYTLLPKVWNMSLTASVVILVVLLARLALKRAPKVFSYALWAVVLFRLLCPVSLSSGLSLFSVLDAPVSEQNTLEYVPPDIVHTEDPEVNLPVPGVSAVINEAMPYGLEQLVADPLETPVYQATMLWLLGIAVLLIYSVASLLRLRQKLAGSARLRDNIRLADHISSPFVLGLFRPRIYLPSSLPEGERGYIILHEQHHIRRLDHVVKLLAFAALCIHWFNPLVWVAFVLSGKDMEMSCDEAVLRKMGEDIRADYSQSLLNLATGRRVIAGTPLAFGEGDTKSRVKNALKWKRPAVWVVLLAVIVCAAVIFICALNPKGDEDFAPEPFGASYSVEEVIYNDIRFSSIAPGTSLDYSFTEDHELLCKGADWESIGALTEVKLTKSRFDAYFREELGWTEGFSAAALRQNNQQAWQLLSDKDGYSYYVLLQKNGETYLACWYYDEERESHPLADDSVIRCVLKLTQTGTTQNISAVGGADAPTRVAFSIADSRAKAQAILSHETLVELEPVETGNGTLREYTQPAELYGASNHQTWLIWEDSGGDKLLLQDGGLSTMEAYLTKGNAIYVIGRYYGFSTISGLNVVRYTITEEQVLAESALDESSLGGRFTVIQDESNPVLRSIVPNTEDGMGRLNLVQISAADLSFTAWVPDDPDWTDELHFRFNENGLFYLE